MERIDALQQEHRDLMAGFRSHFGHHAPRKLEEEQSAYFAKLQRGSVDATRMPLADMASFFADWPGSDSVN